MSSLKTFLYAFYFMSIKCYELLLIFFYCLKITTNNEDTDIFIMINTGLREELK